MSNYQTILYLWFRVLYLNCLTKNLATLISPDGQAKYMKIQFKIKEQLTDIISEILSSDRWITHVKEDRGDGLKRLVIKDPHFDSEASIDIWKNEIHISTAWSNYTYRIYVMEDAVWCEYIGAYRGLLEQKLLPQITPNGNILDSEVIGSSLLGEEVETLRGYSSVNQRNRGTRNYEKRGEEGMLSDHPRVVHDEFIKIGVPMPPPENN